MTNAWVAEQFARLYASYYQERLNFSVKYGYAVQLGEEAAQSFASSVATRQALADLETSYPGNLVVLRWIKARQSA